MDNKRCVCCGAPLDWERRLARCGSGDSTAWAGWERRTFSAFGVGSVSAIPAGVEWERRRPVRSAAVESDVVTPVLQSAISGLVIGVVASVVAVVASVPRPVLIGVGAGSGVLAVTWGVLLGEHRRLLWEVERIIGADVDGDGVAGDPVTVESDLQPQVTRVEVDERHNGSRRIRYVDVPLSDRELERLARAVLERRERFSRRGLSDLLSQSQYSAVYSAMLDGGLLFDTGNGNELTAAGRAFLRQYLAG